MKIRLAENIKAFRKEQKLTQEQLAEALGVTVGAVHKWENGASMPEIRLLLEMAALFGRSVDAMLGYEQQNNSVDAILERITDSVYQKDYDTAAAESEKALLRYPNNFRIVCYCSGVYERMGVERADKHSLERAITLFERAITLLSQNDDPDIDEVTLQSQIATCYLELEQEDKALEILKRYNPGGINNTMIALTYAMSEKYRPEEAEQYMTDAFFEGLTAMTRCMTSYANYYIRTGNYEALLETGLWLIKLYDASRCSELCYFDKIQALILAACACACDRLGRNDDARSYLEKAYDTAQKFDASPVYDMSGIRFCVGNIDDKVPSDDIGATAMLAIEQFIEKEKWCSKELLGEWKNVKMREMEKK